MIYHILTSNNRRQPDYHDYERRSRYHNIDDNYSSSSSSSDSWSSWSSDSWSSSSDGGGFSGGSTGDW